MKSLWQLSQVFYIAVIEAVPFNMLLDKFP